MSSILNEQIVVAYTCCGPTYRKSAYHKIKNYYFDDDNIYYCILTDDKSYFSDLKRKNLIVNELKDFYSEYPNLEKNEFFLESKNKKDYGRKFITLNYKFPFSTYRFNILQSIKLGIKNVALLCTDTVINFNNFNNDLFKSKNLIYNAVSAWWENTNDNEKRVGYMNMKNISDYLKKYDYELSEKILVLDEAARLYIPESLEDLNIFFNIWNEVIEFLYDGGQYKEYFGSYVIHDEYILAVIYNFLKMNIYHGNVRIFEVNHNQKIERFWT
jgi:hypothetical protein